MEGLLANDDVESTSNLRRIYVESMSNPNLCRIYVENTVFSCVKTLGRVLGDIKSPCGNGNTLSSLGEGPVSNSGPPGCVVRVPDHWAI